jgi:2-amino-4-hydroxy-6-hydroxymethyldihydropteridine diphosphokinase
MADVFLGLGSNRGERENNIWRALDLLEKSGDVKIKDYSSFYEGEPLGVTNQTDFLNCVVRADTNLDPHALLRLIKSLEGELGRRPNTHLRPRPIDIDILLYDEIDLESLDLMIPHSRLKTRRFVLEPILEIDPDLIDPVSGKPFREFLSEVSSQRLRRTLERKEVIDGTRRPSEA